MGKGTCYVFATCHPLATHPHGHLVTRMTHFEALVTLVQGVSKICSWTAAYGQPQILNPRPCPAKLNHRRFQISLWHNALFKPMFMPFHAEMKHMLALALSQPNVLFAKTCANKNVMKRLASLSHA